MLQQIFPYCICRWLISNTDHYQRGLGLLCNDDFVLRLLRNYPSSHETS
uniref:Uncharacterized protein n=1 Tax=Vitis vinifera TaxID=29760 RepID=F6GVJ2_VITVI